MASSENETLDIDFVVSRSQSYAHRHCNICFVFAHAFSTISKCSPPQMHDVVHVSNLANVQVRWFSDEKQQLCLAESNFAIQIASMDRREPLTLCQDNRHRMMLTVTTES
jgi:hypothetical protein